MPIRLDDLRVGKWVAIESDAAEPVENPFGDYSFFGRQAKKGSLVNGQPLQIKAISLPFLAVTDGNHRFSLDTREVRVCLLDSKYVKAMTQEKPVGTKARGVAVPERRRKKKPATQVQTTCRICPECQAILREVNQSGEWFFRCNECGFLGGRPKR